MLNDFGWIIILFPLFAALAGYFLRVRMLRNNQSKLAELEQYKRKIKELESRLEASQQKNLSYQNEISSIQSKLQNIISNQLEKAPPTEEIGNRLGKTVPIDGSLDDSVAIAPVDENPEDQQQKQKSSKRTSKFEALKSDNLQIVEGIGPKMESVLKENGVQNWSQLGSQTNTSLRAILEKYGNKYKIIDPDSWPAQAQLASVQNWSELTSLQKGLYAGNDIPQIDTQAKVEKVMVKLGILKMYKQDDLKAIEGIGPKIAELLNSEGISLWKELAQTSELKLQSILDRAGKRYQLADPSSWPKQAALAHEGRFDELTDYQDLLIGGS